MWEEEKRGMSFGHIVQVKVFQLATAKVLRWSVQGYGSQFYDLPFNIISKSFNCGIDDQLVSLIEKKLL